MKRARYHVAARDELRSAISHGEDERPGRGVSLEESVRRVIRRIQLLPASAPRWPRLEAEIRRAKVRRHPYLVVYVVLPDQLVVLAIAHTSKKPGYWRERISK